MRNKIGATPIRFGGTVLGEDDDEEGEGSSGFDVGVGRATAWGDKRACTSDDRHGQDILPSDSMARGA